MRHLRHIIFSSITFTLDIRRACRHTRVAFDGCSRATLAD